MSDSFDGQRQSRPAGAAANGWLVMVLIALVGVLMFRTLSETLRSRPDYTPRVVTPRGELGADEKSTIRIFQLAAPSVVYVRTKGLQPTLFGGALEREFASGTGIVWDESGHVITNLHVVREIVERNRTALQVQFIDGHVSEATFIGAVYEDDIAVLRVDAPASRLQPITLGSSDDLQVGQRVLAIGNPFGFDHTLSTGVIGGLNRSVPTETPDEFLSGLIQTDAAINPGNSGGPLLDSAGRLIGVNTAIVSSSGASAGLGFAVPVANVMRSVERVMEAATEDPSGELGVALLDPVIAKQIGIPDDLYERGPMIRKVFPNTAADAAGLRQLQVQQTFAGIRITLGDQILSVDGDRTRTAADLREQLQSRRPGESVTLRVVRGSNEFTVAVTLQPRKLLL